MGETEIKKGYKALMGPEAFEWTNLEYGTWATTAQPVYQMALRKRGVTQNLQ